jgi:predicted ABC-type ATPase
MAAADKEERHRMTGDGGSVDGPNVYVIAGPNGAGKTTFATEFLPDFVECREFLNADLIAAGLSPFAPESQNVRAGQLLLERIDEVRKGRRDFGFETTLSGRSYARLLRQMREDGYRVNLFFLWLPCADMAVARVANRVRQGGHNVPEHDIRRRYVAGQRNLFGLYRPLVSAWWLYDASHLPPTLVAGEADGTWTIVDTDKFGRIQYGISGNLQMIEPSKTTGDLSAKAEAAFQRAAEKVVERARQTGTPVLVWKDNRVTELDPA